MNTSEIIGKKIEYEAGGQVHTGKILDRFRTTAIRQGDQVQLDLYLIESEGVTYKISPMQIKRVLL